MKDSVRHYLTSAQRNIDITRTTKGTWFITTPCGQHLELPGERSQASVRAMANRHRARCCRAARITVETSHGYLETKGSADIGRRPR